MGKIKKTFLIVLGSILAIIAIALGYFNFPVSDEKIDHSAELGLTFSYRYAEDIGLDWQETYLAILDDLGVKKVRVPVYWNSVEEVQDQYNWERVDWQLDEAARRNVEVILVLGQKVPRWPECYIPEWAKDDKKLKDKELLEIVAKSVERYKSHPAVKFWQVENEPFLAFGVCPPLDKDLLDQEISIVRTLDPSRELIVTDSGELSLWVQAAKRADVFGTTMYLEVVSEKVGRWKYPIGPRFFHFKKWLIETFADQERGIVVELQAEPWISGWTTSRPLEEQFSSMNEKKLVENINFARKTGFPIIYLWGGEWWYWLKTTQDYPALWETAKTMFNNQRTINNDQ